MAPPVTKCEGCRIDILCQPYLICCQCKGPYERQCTGLSESKYRTLSKAQNHEWTCQLCSCNKPKKDNSNTPVRAALTDTNKYINVEHNASMDISLNQSVADPYRNITMRKQTTDIVGSGWHSEGDGNDTCGLDSIRAMIREELRFTMEERLPKIISKLVSDQICEITKSVADLKDRVVSLENRLSLSSNRSMSNASTQTESSNKLLKKSPIATCKPDKKNARSNPVVERSKTTSLDADSGREVVQATNMSSASALVGIKQKFGNEDSSVDIINGRKTSDSAANSVTPESESAKSTASTQPAANSIEPQNDSITDRREVKMQDKRTHPSLASVVRGSAAPGTTALEASERTIYLHLYYVRQGTTQEEVKLHLDYISGSKDICSVVTLKARGNYASFKLGIPPRLVDTVLAGENWAKDICVKPWRDNFRRQSGKTYTE